MPLLYDLDGHAVDPFVRTDRAATVFFFLRTDCPIANSYAPEIRRFYLKFAPRRVAFWLVYLDPAQASREILEHIKDYQLPGDPLRDAKLRFAGRCGAQVTPEAALFAADGRLTYVGRIDDRYVAFGKRKRAFSSHDLEDALEATLAGKHPAPPKGPAIGCLIRDLK